MTDNILPDSGSRSEFTTGAVRDAMSGKGLPSLIPPEAIRRLAAAEGEREEDHLGAVLWNAAAWIWTEDQIRDGLLPGELDDRTYTSEV